MQKKVILSASGILVLVTLMACQLSSLIPTTTAPTPAASTALPAAPATDLVSQQDKLVAIYQAAMPGVVAVQTGNSFGSGWVYSRDGYVVTNQHVVANETQAEVDFPSGVKVFGTVVGADPNSDLAVVKVDVPADQLHPLALGDSSRLQVGQIVVAIGNPEFLTGTMTTGIISGLGLSQASNAPASSTSYFAAGDFIETDALLNPGNSGGPLLDLNGQVVGVNRSIQVDINTGASTGLGYAISVDIVKRVVPALIQNGKFDYPYLGISTLDNFPLSVINELGLKSTTGVYVTDVTAGGPCDQAGIKAGTQPSSITGLNAGGDLIVAVDGQPVQEFGDMIRYIILNKAPGDTVTFTVLRGDQSVDLPVTLGIRP